MLGLHAKDAKQGKHRKEGSRVRVFDQTKINAAGKNPFLCMKSDCNKATAVSRINNGYIWIFCQHRLYLNGIKEQSVHGLFANCWGFFCEWKLLEA